jgi:putative transposase
LRRAFKFRLYPTKSQEREIEQIIETNRRLYNAGLEQRIIAYKEHGKSLSFYDQKRELKEARKVDPYLARITHDVEAATLQRLDRAFQNFFRRLKTGEKPGFPRFQGRNHFDSVVWTKHGSGCKFSSDITKWKWGKTYFQYIGHVRTLVHRQVQGIIKTVAIKREADQWYVVLSCDLGEVAIQPTTNTQAVGIDLGLTSFLTTSDGEHVGPPKFYRNAQRELRVAQRALSRKQRGSNRRKKSRLRVAKLHQKVTNQRKYWHYQTALWLVRRYGLIAHEQLNIRGIAKTRLAKSTLDAAWGNFLFILNSKAEEAGCHVVAVNPKNTTQKCSQCGELPEQKVTLAQRTYYCQHCGYQANRDYNAAINVLQLAVA